MSEEELGQRDIWAHLATYLVEIHRIEDGVRSAGGQLDINTAHGKWTGLQLKRQRYAMRLTVRAHV